MRERGGGWPFGIIIIKRYLMDGLINIPSRATDEEEKKSGGGAGGLGALLPGADLIFRSEGGVENRAIAAGIALDC